MRESRMSIRRTSCWSLVVYLLLWVSPSVAVLPQAPLAQRPNHLLGPRFLRFYVAEIPPEYSYLRAFDDPYRFPDSPLDYLGPLQHPQSVPYSTYNSDYNRGVCINPMRTLQTTTTSQDRAFWHTLTSSPLRVATPAQADFIYVPVFWLLLNESFMQPFMDNAFSHLPLLGQKPHVVVLARPRHEHTKNNDPVVRVVVQHACTRHLAQTNHEHAKHFIFLSPVVPNIFTPGVVRLHIQQRAGLIVTTDVPAQLCDLPLLSRGALVALLHAAEAGIRPWFRRREQGHAHLAVLRRAPGALLWTSILYAQCASRLSTRACLRRSSCPGTCSTCSASKPTTATAAT